MIGEYGEPIYAQWTYGKGKVGSFMCDLSGHWSEEFVTKPDGKKMIECIAGALFPTASVHDSGIDVDVSADNCTASVNVSTEVADGEYIQVAIKSPEIGAGSDRTWFRFTNGRIFRATKLCGSALPRRACMK